MARGLEARELAVLMECFRNQQTSGFAAESGLDVLPLTLFSLETLPEVTYHAVRQLGAKWCAEPSVHGGKKRP